MKSKKILLCVGLLLVFAAVAFYVRERGGGDAVENGSRKEEARSSGQEDTLSAGAEEDGSPEDVDTIEGRINPDTEEPVSDITMTFAGDLMASDYILSNYDSSGIGGVIDETLLGEMRDADISMVNEEFPFGTGGEPAQDKQYTFKADPSYVSILKDLGTDVVTLANNHTLDFGPEVLTQTFDALDAASIPYVGAGKDLERASDWETFQLDGRTVGILAASRVIPVIEWDVRNRQPGIFTTYDPEILNAQIAAAKKKCDFVAVYVHWGVERQEEPEEYQRELARGYIDAGADLVIGSHPHVLQGIEYYKGVPIVYSLGNYMFYQNIESTGLLKAVWKADGTLSLQLIPASASGAKTTACSGDAKKAILDHVESISFDVKIDDDGNVSPR